MKSERDLFLDTIKEIVETNNWDGNKDKKIKYLQSQLDHQKDKWQKLKEWLDRVFQIYLNESDHKMMSIYGTILDKMQELEGEDE